MNALFYFNNHQWVWPWLYITVRQAYPVGLLYWTQSKSYEASPLASWVLVFFVLA